MKQPLKILCAGGGSGGHITPVVAIIQALYAEKPRAEIHFWTNPSFYKISQEIMPKKVKISRVVAGKFRRFAHFKPIDYLKNPQHMLRNIRDAFLFIISLFQSFFKLFRLKPNIIFLKGGFVCLPIGLTAHLLKIPYIIHDSDSLPGLTNRILSKHATKILTGMPLENYNYSPERAVYVGIPIDPAFRPVSSSAQSDLKVKLGFDPKKPLTLINGGSLGAERLNLATIDQLPNLLSFTQVFISIGKNQDSSISDELAQLASSHSSLQYATFVPSLADLVCASDLVISRSGATAIAELAAAGKTAILVPNDRLPGHHQTKNAESLASSDAVEIISDEKLPKQPSLLTKSVQSLLSNPKKSQELSKNLHKFAKPNAAPVTAQIILDNIP